ncbi:MAG: hypothetical protein D8M58_17880 [Calditrichaeota bacterium]|nr:MAG: hypothetical protein DWQ03_01795 [Calditrichota bacterium]MBL1207278.1 hypothetical protein [Calditrichota bacterium]NOG47110.1 hypothetical protein [Calditrichota bacterium]
MQFCFINVEKAEEQVILKPGDLLILNNISTIHARLGKRKTGELYQLIAGISDVLVKKSSIVKHWLVEQLSS